MFVINKYRFKIKRHPLFLYALLLTVFFASYAHAETANINLFLGDGQSRICIEAIKEIEKSYPLEKNKILFRVFTTQNLGNAALSDGESKTIFILHTMDSKSVEKASPYASSVIANGGKVYAVGGSYFKEHKDAGMISDEMISRYQKKMELRT